MAAQGVKAIGIPDGDIDGSRPESDHAFRVGQGELADALPCAIEHIVTSVRLLGPLCAQHYQFAVRRCDPRVIVANRRESDGPRPVIRVRAIANAALQALERSRLLLRVCWWPLPRHLGSTDPSA